MAIRTINGPGRRATQEYVTAGEAGEFLGCGAKTFRKIVLDHPWCRPKLVGGAQKYHWLDVIAIGRIIDSTPEGAARDRPIPEEGGQARQNVEKPGKTRKEAES